MKVAGLAVWGGAQRRTKLTDEQVPLSLSTLASALPPELGTIGPDHRHRPKPFRPLCPPVDGVDRVDSGGQLRKMSIKCHLNAQKKKDVSYKSIECLLSLRLPQWPRQ